jgi:hypothetical protein
MIVFFDVLGFRALAQKYELPDLVRAFQIFYGSVLSAGVRLQTRRAIRDGKADDEDLVLEDFRLDHAEDVSSDSPGDVVRALQKATGWSLFLLSDSIVMYSPEVHEGEAEGRATEAVLLSRVAAMRFFESRLPVRGAIAFGELHADRDAQIYCGSGLIEAYEVAESQDWLGVAVAPSAAVLMEALVKHFNPQHPHEGVRPGWDLIRWDVPFKSGTRPSWIVNWASAWNYGGYVRDDFFEQRLKGDPAIDAKYEHTLEFLQTWFGRWVAGECEGL